MKSVYPEKALKGCIVRHELNAHSVETRILLAFLVWEEQVSDQRFALLIPINFTIVGLEDDVVGLREAHDEDEVDDKESEEVFGNHPVDHDHKGADNLECPGEKSLVAMRMQEMK